jgi:hypothetical protein
VNQATFDRAGVMMDAWDPGDDALGCGRAELSSLTFACRTSWECTPGKRVDELRWTIWG